MRWVVDLVRGTGGVGGARAGPEYVWSPGAPMTVCRAQEAVIAHVDASVRPHVREEPTHARVGGHRTDAELSRGRCLVLQGDLVLCPRAEAMVAEGHAKAVRGEICAGCLACADGRAGHDPIRVPDRCVHPRAPGGLVPWRSARGSADHGQGRDVDQAVVTGRPPGALGSQTASGHEIMPGRRVAPSAGPRLEHPDHPEPAAAASWSHRQCLPGLSGAPTVEVGEGVLVATGQGSACHRERQGHQDVRERQPQTLVVVEPWLGLVLLARGTGPVLTGVGAVLVLWAGRTGRALAAARRRAARRHVLPGPPMTGPPPVATCGTGRGAMAAAHLRALHQPRSAMLRVMASAPRCAALAVRGV